LFDDGFAASVGLIVAAPDLEARGVSDGAASISTPPMLHLRWSGETFGLGASFSVPFGSKVKWPDGWDGRFELEEARLQILRTEAFAGLRFGMVSFTLGGFVDVGRLGFVKAIDFVDAEGRTSLETSAIGFGGQASVSLRIDGLDVGLSYQSRSRMGFDGYADFSVPAEFSVKAHDQRVSAELVMPDRFRLGVRYRITDTVDVMGDLELVLWSTVKELALDFEDEATTDQILPRNWRTTVVPRIGATWQAFDFLAIRGGVFVDPSPVPEATVSPSSPDSTRIGLSAGAGAEIYAGIGVDVAYQLLVFTGAKSVTGDLAGTEYGGLAHLFGASLRVAL
jgi:long-chain fatty acid transport protein